MAKRLLLQENACEAWRAAIHYCECICFGKATLYNKKQFVANLHNATELFFKQIMINNNDYRVCSFNKGINAEGEPAKTYYSSPNLVEYFSKATKDELNKLFSVEFNKLIDYRDSILSQYGEAHDLSLLKSQLNLLNTHRNNETHFYISNNDFLNDNDFLKLHNYMVTLNDIIRYYHLIPEGADERLEYSGGVLNAFDLKEILRSYPVVIELKNQINEKQYHFDEPTSSYDITSKIFNDIDFGNMDVTFEDLAAYISVLLDKKLLKIKEKKGSQLYDITISL